MTLKVSLVERLGGLAVRRWASFGSWAVERLSGWAVGRLTKKTRMKLCVYVCVSVCVTHSEKSPIQ